MEGVPLHHPTMARVEHHHVRRSADRERPSWKAEDPGRDRTHALDQGRKGKEPRLDQLADGEAQRGLQADDAVRCLVEFALFCVVVETANSTRHRTASSAWR